MNYNCPVFKEIPRAPYIKSKGFLNQLVPIVMKGIPLYADSVRNPDCVNTVEYEEFWDNEFNKIVNGFWIKDIWIPGRFYFYMNYKQMSTIRGVITPDVVDMHLELAYHIEHCLANGKNLLIAKGRRKGISEAVSTMVVDYGWRFTEGFKAGVAAGNKTYVEDFVAKWRFSDSRMPVELSTKKLTDNDDEIVAGYNIKNQHGAYEEKGTMNTIYARTMHTNPNMFKGLYLNVIISEEVGEHENWISFYGASKDCLMSGNQQVGILIAFGTAGNINKGSKDFKKIWQDYETFNFVRYMIPADRFYFYGDARNENQRIPAESELLKKYSPYQLIGVEDRANALKNIMDRRAALLKQGNIKEYNEDLQNNPINESEMFRKTVVNNFNVNKLNDQQSAIDNLSHPKYTKYKLDWVKDKQGMIKMPMEVVARVLQPQEDQDECIWIIDGEMPRKNHSNLHTAGCLLPGGKVMTENGLMNIEDVSLDNMLINAEGQYVKINELQRYYLTDERVFDVSVCNTIRNTTFTSEHPILTSSAILKQFYKKNSDEYEFNQSFWKFDGFEYKTVDSIKVGEWIKVPNIYRKPNDFDINSLWSDLGVRVNRVIKSPLYDADFWWFIGLWLGDGYCDDKKGKISLSINKKETEYIIRLKKIVSSLFDRSLSIRDRDKGCLELTFTSGQLSRFLKNNFGKYAHGKILPEWAKHINLKCKKELITGYLDSDGCIKLEEKRQFYSFGFVSINQEMLEGFQDVLFSMGIVSNIGLLRDEKVHYFKGHNEEGSKTKRCYQLRMGHNDTINLVKMLKKDDKNHKLNRVDLVNYKKTRRRPNDGCFIDKSMDYIYFQITAIKESLYTGVVYNFDCETHTYMCHHITTHNCDSYDQDQAKASKSLGAMCIRIRDNNITGATKRAPIAVISCRPRRKELFYELCLKAAVFYDLVGNVLVDVGAGLVMQYFKENGGWKYLADRPRKFESETSEQTHEKGVRLTTFSRPRMSGLMQADIEDNVENIWFPELINQLGNFDEVEIGSDNDLADAYGLSLMQDVSCEVKPRDNEANDIPDRFELPVFKNGRMVGVDNPITNIQQDTNLFKMMFGGDA